MPINIVDDTVMSDDIIYETLNGTHNTNDLKTFQEYNEINKTNILKEFILTLEEKLNYLREEVKFMREDSVHKSTIINNLVATIRKKETERFDSSDSSINSDESKSMNGSYFVLSNRACESPRKEISKNTDTVLDEVNSTPKREVMQHFTYESFPLIDENLDDSSIHESINSTFIVNDDNMSSLYSQITSEDTFTSEKSNEESRIHVSNEKSSDFAAWEKHTTGFASRMLQKMGYNGGGLGKNENGIINPITNGMLNGRTEQNTKNQARVNNKVYPWPRNTTLITGSSMLCGIVENRLRKYKIKVRPFPGALVDDMYDYLRPLLKKNPANIILHIGSNDAPSKSADEIAIEIENLKSFIQNILPDVKLYISCPILRTDNARANTVLRELGDKLKISHSVVINDNIDINCLGKKGLHLNPKGSGKLAINYISLLRRL